MKALLITVAGTSSRFSRSVGRDTLKCIYYERDFRQSLLYNLIGKDCSFDRFIIVGGFKFGELQSAVDTHFGDLRDKIVLLENTHFADYGSGYSLKVGLEYAVEIGCDEIVFAEGDLWVDDAGFIEVSRSSADVITYTREPIDAKKSVVFYYDRNDTAHYLYDTAHSYLEIGEPFLSVYNSGQIWKFCDRVRVRDSMKAIDETTWRGTNLVFIQKYFGNRPKNDYRLVAFEQWFNCNTIEDFKKMTEERK